MDVLWFHPLRADFCPSRDLWQFLETVQMDRIREYCWHVLPGGQGAGQQLTVHRTAPHDTDLPDPQNVRSVKVETHCPELMDTKCGLSLVRWKVS